MIVGSIVRWTLELRNHIIVNARNENMTCLECDTEKSWSMVNGYIRSSRHYDTNVISDCQSVDRYFCVLWLNYNTCRNEWYVYHRKSYVLSHIGVTSKNPCADAALNSEERSLALQHHYKYSDVNGWSASNVHIYIRCDELIFVSKIDWI